MARLKTAGGDEKLLSGGVWIKHEEYGFEFKIRAIPNPDYSRMQSRLLRPVTKKLTRGKGIDVEDSTAIDRRCIANECLVDWRNIEDENDEAIPFSASKAIEIFNTLGLGHLCDWIMREAGDLGNFQAEEVEEGKVT